MTHLAPALELLLKLLVLPVGLGCCLLHDFQHLLGPLKGAD